MTSVSYLQRDDWSGLIDDELRVPCPSWEQVEEAILSLDGINHTIVTLALNEDCYMVVAGGSDGNYLVFATTGDGTFSHVTDLSKSSEPIPLDIGGQTGEYPKKRCISLDTALEAAKAYFETGSLRSDLSWELA